MKTVIQNNNGKEFNYFKPTIFTQNYYIFYSYIRIYFEKPLLFLSK